jgi:hypothetical protein
MAELFANNTISGSYAEQLRKEHDGSKWGSTGARYSGDDVVALFARYSPSTALDFGCGKGTLAKAFSLSGARWTEYDPGIPGKDTLPEGRFDLVTCTDVLEHVEREQLDTVLKTLGGYCGTALFLDIACYPTGKTFGEGPYKGQDLHLIVEEPSWWEERLEKVLDLQLLESKVSRKLSKGTWKVRAQFVYERV